MNRHEIHGGNASNPLKLIGVIIPLIPSLMFRLTGTLLRFKREANKAGKIFQKELLHQGLDKETAKLFTKEYVDGSNLMKFFHNQS